MSLHNEKEWETFKQKLYSKSGINLNDYKPAQMQRRIGNMMSRHSVTGYLDFFAKLESDAKLYKDFIDFLTINVTEFFRTPEKFDELEKVVLADLLKKSPKLNIWSAGCSTGAEPYSLAIMLNEMTPHTRHRILATDLDKEMLAKAKQGSYTINELKNIPAARLNKYFKQVNGSTVIHEDIRSRVEFKQHNLLVDKFESGFDLILCRNVVIYFTEEAKDALYRRFFAALKPGGVMFVGGTEAILNFREIGFQHYLPFFYRKP
ncbi:MAG TPA: protein-glutamate O-methyltransferase CheR [Methylomusa anaerophila]|uniref:protein-glutamate O-methyltransferase n=1 Tax=Methylomusa anaerophila TaxID=1930071 RepID=A0A348AIA6_9FIRM|nr:protein-glutamate O-methyltransferase CheR [Methylomusa anaerophila]BBB90804.1 chemotaxis protein methyltransferase Cher2 [Methylomusa anaerophila]HML90539.1 protein-glutamate O-methyltransferase CheR [Methylomusa anaerophila]